MKELEEDVRFDRIPDADTNVRKILDPITITILRWIAPGYEAQIESKSSDNEKYEYLKAAEQDILNSFAKRSTGYLIVTMFGLTVLYIICIYNQQVPAQSYGLWLDLVGAIILGRGLISNPVSLAERSTSGWGGWNDNFRMDLARDTVDGMWGISLLVMGILAQSVAVAFFN